MWTGLHRHVEVVIYTLKFHFLRWMDLFGKQRRVNQPGKSNSFFTTSGQFNWPLHHRYTYYLCSWSTNAAVLPSKTPTQGLLERLKSQFSSRNDQTHQRVSKYSRDGTTHGMYYGVHRIQCLRRFRFEPTIIHQLLAIQVLLQLQHQGVSPPPMRWDSWPIPLNWEAENHEFTLIRH